MRHSRPESASLNVESLGELDVVAAEAASLGAVARISVRLNPDVEAGTHAYVSTGSAASKFGLGPAEAAAAYARAVADPALEPVGLSFHVGSQLLDPAPALAAAERAAELWRALAADGIALRDLDVGGGLGIGYDGEEDAAVEPYAAALTAVAQDLGAELVLEPGRWLVGPVGTFVTRVLYVKEVPGRRVVVCDGGMNDLIRPALYGTRHPISLLADDARPRGPVDVVGPVCETGDFFSLGVELPLPEPGDLLTIGQAGAYCRVMASAYNARALCAEVLREDGAYPGRPRAGDGGRAGGERAPVAHAVAPSRSRTASASASISTGCSRAATGSGVLSPSPVTRSTTSSSALTSPRRTASSRAPSVTPAAVSPKIPARSAKSAMFSPTSSSATA